MNPNNDELHPEYDFDISKAVRGKHYQQYKNESNVVVFEPDVAQFFHNSKSVNEALRAMLKFSEQTTFLTSQAA
jgi:hypothetical protein